MYSRASTANSIQHGMQSDDDFQRHEAEQRRREGSNQDRFGQQSAVSIPTKSDAYLRGAAYARGMV